METPPNWANTRVRNSAAGSREDVGVERVVFAETPFEVFEFGDDEEVVRVPV